MIPQANLQAWSLQAPWPDFRQIEQDLIICRALCDLFSAPALNGAFAFRGGTAIHKLLFRQPLRYSEDIDLVQTRQEPIGTTVNAIRKALAWLGKPQIRQAGHSTHLIFRFVPEADLQATLKLKVEINAREHANRFGIHHYPFVVDNDWYRGQTQIASFVPEELFGTKLRALLQRRKNRDLFDLAHGLEQLQLDADKLLASFDHYLVAEGSPITRATAEQRMLEKLNRSLSQDIAPLIPPDIRFHDADALHAFEQIWNTLVVRLKGDPWKSTSKVIEQLRCGRYPTLLLESNGEKASG